MLKALERHLGRFALPRLTLLLAALQLAGLVVAVNAPERIPDLALRPDALLAGEYWRAFSYIMLPVTGSLISFVVLIIFVLMIGSRVESIVGDFRYNLFVLTYWLGTPLVLVVLVRLGVPLRPLGEAGMGVGAGPLLAAIVMAGAALRPDDEFLLFFFIPVKYVFMGLIVLIGLLVYMWRYLLVHDWAHLSVIALALVDYILYFGGHQRQIAKRRVRAVVRQHREGQAKTTLVLHVCAVCGRTERSDPELVFRVCSQCTEGREYCSEHLAGHEHK